MTPLTTKKHTVTQSSSPLLSRWPASNLTPTYLHIAASSPRPRYVTHFPSFEHLSLTYFKVSTKSSMPCKIDITTFTNNPRCPFFSIEHSLASLSLDGCIAQTEIMCKVVTASDAAILDLFQDPKRALEDAGVRWVHQEEWKHAFLEYDGVAMLDDCEIADGMFYTGIAEEVLSSSEKACMMERRTSDLLSYKKFASET